MMAMVSDCEQEGSLNKSMHNVAVMQGLSMNIGVAELLQCQPLLHNISCHALSGIGKMSIVVDMYRTR